MTTKEIAESVGKDYSTVSRWIEKVSCNMQEVYCKVQEAKRTSKPADYEPREVAAIIAQGMGDDVAGIYRENMTNAEMAKQPTVKASRLPSGAQINAMARLYGDQEARKRIDYCLGYTATAPEVTAIAIAENIGRLSKQAYAVEMRNREQAENRDRINKLTPELFK
jgi:hypothetical protein